MTARALSLRWSIQVYSNDKIGFIFRKQDDDYHESPTTDYSTQVCNKFKITINLNKHDLDDICDVSYEAEAESEEAESICPSVASVSIIESSVMTYFFCLNIIKNF